MLILAHSMLLETRAYILRWVSEKLSHKAALLGPGKRTFIFEFSKETMFLMTTVSLIKALHIHFCHFKNQFQLRAHRVLSLLLVYTVYYRPTHTHTDIQPLLSQELLNR